MINKIYAQKLVVFFVRSENDYDKGQVSSWCLHSLKMITAPTIIIFKNSFE